MNQDSESNESRRDGERRFGGRRDDDRNAGPRGNKPQRDASDRPRFNSGPRDNNDRPRPYQTGGSDRPRVERDAGPRDRSGAPTRPRDTNERNRSNQTDNWPRRNDDRPRFGRDTSTGLRNDGPRNSGPERPRADRDRRDSPRSTDTDQRRPRLDGHSDHSRFERNKDRPDRNAGSDQRSNSFPERNDDRPRVIRSERPGRDNTGDRFGRPDRFSERSGNDRTGGPRSDRDRNEDAGENRPRFNRSTGPRDADTNRPRFDRKRTDGFDDRRREGNTGGQPSRPNRDGKPSGSPAFKRVGGFSRDADERNRFGDERNSGGSRRDRSTGAPADRFSPEQRKDSGERRTGRYEKAPNYNLDQRPYERRERREDFPRGGSSNGGSRDGGSRNSGSQHANSRFDKPKDDRTGRSEGNRPGRTADDHRSDEPGTTRLNRYIANSGVCSRREADELIARGDISVNGKVVTEMGYKVKEGDTVKFGTKMLNPERFVYVLLNKPKDYITTTDDPAERKTVMELVADAGNFRLYPVGRLDRNTTGLLLLTNDGELADKLTHPSNNIRKIYQVEIDKPITEEDFEAIQKGVDLEDGPIRPDALSIVTPDAQVVGIEIHSGRNRIVRRLFEQFGYEVTKLDRTTFAGLTKKDLPRGKWRFLDPKEVVKLKYFN